MGIAVVVTAGGVSMLGSAASVALLQYTSGSTGAPKGVVLTHADLLADLELVRHGFGATPDDTGVSWLPPYHDMGSSAASSSRCTPGGRAR